MAHHFPGRIRIKLKPELLFNPQALELARSRDFSGWGNGNGSPAIIKTRLNLKAGSLVVDYDPQMVQPELLGELFNTSDPHRVKELVEQLAEALGLEI